ncbi:YccT family protein [Desulfobacter latus]|uniref:DUF2057 domain-containing protein n=1 Tax=Desulfobacter latus TaxID=2292 RepID=A0A850TA43_9BACT|nr:DUF2057 domain-containing protein [Desulfobacter latus]NWH06205.1 DUF2057 domain-containing protein [Desulfobacter latus]
MRKIAKKLIRYCIIGGTSCFICTSGPPAWADVTMNLPEKIAIVAENGKNTKINKKIALPDGDNQIVIQFQGELSRKHADEDADFENSDAFVIRFNASNQALRMVIPRIKRLLELEKWNKKPDIRILDSAGRELDIQIARLKIDGFQIFRNYETELEAFNKTDSPAALNTLSTVSGDYVPNTVPVPAVSPKHRSQPQGKTDMAEDMLEYWYQQADEETKARFKQRINKK